MAKIVSTEPICPHCGDWVLETDCYDTDYDNDEFYHKCVGQCQGCRKAVLYTEVYEYKGVTNIKEG